MKETQKQSNYNHTMSHPLWGLITHYLNWQIEARNQAKESVNEQIIHSINLSILLNLNSMVEGYVEDLLSSKISRYHLNRAVNHKIEKLRPTQDRLFERRLVNKLTAEVDKNTWNKMLVDFELIFGRKINSIVHPEVWKSISYQFTLRNMIAHGNTIAVKFSYDETGEETLEWNKNYQKVYDYFREKKLIEEMNPRHLKLMQLFEAKVVDHLLINAIKFIEQLNIELDGTNTSMHSMVIQKYLKPIKEKFSI